MNLVNLLIASKQFIGINAPLFAWMAALILLLSALWASATLFVKVYKFRASEKKLQSALAKLPKTTLGTALTLTGLDQIRLEFTKLPLFSRCWTQLQQKVIRRTGASGDEYWLSVPASEILERSSVTDAYINREWYDAIPGILAGTGLLVTFVAILVALLHVHLKNNRVEGIDLLIEGLSGKFVSSIAALLAATLFVIFEKTQLHKLDRSVTDLTDAIDAVIPALTTMHVLVELQKDMGEQSVAFRAFNADLAGRLKQSFSESMGPTLERMVIAVEDLNHLLRAAEAAKSDTISESLGGMISRLETSLADSLGKMGEQFTSSLSGSTMTQFARLSDSVAGTASVLEQMNTQNQATQSALTELVTFAKNSTTEQMALGRSQIEDLTNVLRSVLTQIEQTTGSSVKDMGAALTALMSDLSTRVTELTEHSRTTMAQSSQASADVAKAVLKDASDWSVASKEQLATLIEKHTSQLNTVDRLRGALEESANRFNTSASHFNSILVTLQKIVSDTSVCTTAMSGAAKAVKDSQDSLQRIAGLTSTQVENLALAGREQQNLIGRISQAMQQYEYTFAKVETSASSLLQTLERNLSQHLELCQKGYDSLIKVSDEHFSSATQRLGATVDELQEYLQDLSEVLATRSAGKAPHGN